MRPARFPAECRPVGGRSLEPHLVPGEHRATAASARSANSVAAAESDSRSVSSAGTGHRCSSAARRPSRLVVRILTAAERERIASTVSAAALRTCSQLSSTSSLDRPSRAEARLSVMVIPACWVMPSTAATASGTTAGSVTAASSMTHTPSGKSGDDRAATSIASRVFPTPPTPVSVTSRCALSAVATSESSESLPMRRVVGGRRLPGVAPPVFSGGNSERKPAARTWDTSTGLTMSRSRRGPKASRSTPVKQLCGDAVDQDLTAVARRHHACGAVQHGAEVVLAT